MQAWSHNLRQVKKKYTRLDLKVKPLLQGQTSGFQGKSLDCQEVTGFFHRIQANHCPSREVSEHILENFLHSAHTTPFFLVGYANHSSQENSQNPAFWNLVKVWDAFKKQSSDSADYCCHKSSRPWVAAVHGGDSSLCSSGLK